MALHKLHPSLQNFVKDKWREGLTQIQAAAFDPIFDGQHCVIEAPTSGGKTEAVLFPLLTRISSSKKDGFKILYIAPLKALLNDLELRVVPYAKMCFMEAFKWHGDVSQGAKVEQMVAPADVLLTTPESIEAILLLKGNWTSVFQNLEAIVIDEAHYFALTERGSHLLSLLERICFGIKKTPQRIAVTATIGNPDELLKWITGAANAGSLIRVESTSKKAKDFKAHFFEFDGLRKALYQLLVNKKSIVFERSRTWTEETATSINNHNVNSHSHIPVRVQTHHSSVSKRLREESERSIKQSGESSLNAIISTSTLELGIDIGELDQVIQVGGLNSSGSFLQRVGRTGRRKERPQFFRGLCDDPDELVLLTGCMNLGVKGMSENVLFPKQAFHILAHQIICLCLQNNGATPDQIWDVLSNAYCFSSITKSNLIKLIDHMVETEYLRRDSGNVILTGDKTEEQFFAMRYRRLFAIFDTGPMYNVVDGKKIVGTLDASFARAQKLPFVFVLGGKEWDAIKLDHELQQILVKKNQTGLAPKWRGIGYFDVPFELAQEIGLILMNQDQLDFLDNAAANELEKKRNTLFKLRWKRNDWIIEVGEDNTTIYLWTFAGDKINRALGNLLMAKLPISDWHDYSVIEIVAKKGQSVSAFEIQEFLHQCKFMSQQELTALVEENISKVWFSKFSECLPESLAIRTIGERDFDINGLMRELEKCNVLV